MPHATRFARRLRSAAGLTVAVLGLVLATAGNGSAAFLSIPTDLVVGAGGTVTVPVNLTTDSNPASFLSVDIALDYDSSLFTISNIRSGSLTTGFSILSFSPAPGELNATQSTVSDVTLGANSVASVLLFDLTAGASAPDGTSIVNLLAERGNFVTQIDEGATPLNPPPTNGNTDSVDGLITIRGTVPEPASIALFSVGGALMVRSGRRLRRRPA
jgi:hypothetical protein